MKFLISILAASFIFACHNISQNKEEASAGSGPWIIRDSTVQFYSYTKEGLLDSSLKTWYHFHNDLADLSLNTLFTRLYDNAGHLIEVRSFNFLPKGNNWDLDGRTIKTYDAEGNLVLEELLDIKKAKTRTSRITKMTYNELNQEIYRIEISRSLEPDSNNWNVDSAVAHLNDDKVLRYDTFVISSTYDRNGNVIKEIYGRPGRPNEQILSTIYSQGIKDSTISMNSNGDTSFIYQYDDVDGLTRETKKYRKIGTHNSIDTSWYKGERKVKSVYYSNNFKEMRLFDYDLKGNVIWEVSYK